jgi:GDP-4-dehydro-6-deoxy-D-mannose reductase
VRALVTGAGGFAGQWLCRELVRQGWTVTGSTIGGAPPEGILAPVDHALVRWRTDDLRVPAAVADAIDDAQPTAIFHLAGVAFVPAAGDDPHGAFDVNVGIAITLLDAVRRRRAVGGIDPVVLLVGSGEQYGRHDAGAMPLPETAECRPRSFYAATKLAQESFGLAAYRADGVKVIATRSFNHSGRGQSPGFLLPALVARAATYRVSPSGGIAIGNTDVVRDFLHVEDVARAYRLLAEHGLPGEVYNVCSGQAVEVGVLAREVLAAAGLADVPFSTDPTLQRQVDTPCLVGANDKLRADTGWTPSRTRADIISDLLHAAQN